MQVRPHSRFCFDSFEDCVSERLRGHWCQQHHRFVFLPGLWWEVRGSNHQQLGSHESIWDLQGHCQKCCGDNGQGLSRSNISIHFQQSPAEDDWRCWKLLEVLLIFSMLLELWSCRAFIVFRFFRLRTKSPLTWKNMCRSWSRSWWMWFCIGWKANDFTKSWLSEAGIAGRKWQTLYQSTINCKSWFRTCKLPVPSPKAATWQQKQSLRCSQSPWNSPRCWFKHHPNISKPWTFVTTAWSMMYQYVSDGFRYASGLSQHSLDIIIISSRFEGALMHCLSWLQCGIRLISGFGRNAFRDSKVPLGARYQSSNTQQFFQTGWNVDPGIQKNRVQCLQLLGISWALHGLLLPYVAI